MNFDKLFTEEEAVKIANKVLDNLYEKFEERLSEEFYDRMSEYLYEHYDNATEEIKYDLIKQMGDFFKNDPKNYRFIDFRKRLIEENKDAVMEALTPDLVRNAFSDYFFGINSPAVYIKDLRNFLIDFIVNNWKDFDQKYGLESGALERFKNILPYVRRLERNLSEGRQRKIREDQKYNQFYCGFCDHNIDYDTEIKYCENCGCGIIWNE